MNDHVKHVIRASKQKKLQNATKNTSTWLQWAHNCPS